MPLGRIILDYDYISVEVRRNTYSTLLPLKSRSKSSLWRYFSLYQEGGRHSYHQEREFKTKQVVEKFMAISLLWYPKPEPLCFVKSPLTIVSLSKRRGKLSVLVMSSNLISLRFTLTYKIRLFFFSVNLASSFI